MILTEELLELANKFVMDNDRMLYKPYFECVEQFCSDNSVLIGGRVGIIALTGGSLTRDDFVWDLYCDNAFATAKSLAGELATVKSHIPSDTVAVQTNIKYKEFTIYLQARTLFRLFSMDKYRGIRLVDVMNPPSKPGYFTDVNVGCVSADVQLIDVYRTLYSPSMIGLWERELETEKKLFGMVTEVSGDHIESPQVGEIVGGLAGNEYHAMILQSLLLNYVIIGDYAIKYLGGNINPDRLQFITSEDADVVKKAIERIIGNKRLTISKVKYDLNLLNDFQLTKFTIYVSDGKRQSPIVDVFNSTQYELIPYSESTPNTVKRRLMLASPWVIMRFLFIDNWILSLVKQLKVRDGSCIAQLDSKIQSNLGISHWVRSIATFNVDNLTGIYTNESVAKKKLIKDIGERFPMYYPAKVGGSNYSKFTTRPINLVDNLLIKSRIIKKITKQDTNPTSEGIMKSLREYQKHVSIHKVSNDMSEVVAANDNASNVNWGTNKSLDGIYQKNRQLLDHIKQPIGTYLDIGCGSGLDACSINEKYKPGKTICVDITDTRQCKTGEFILIEPGKPIPLSDGSIDLVTMFHVIHHMENDPQIVIDDIARMLIPGGTLLIKDHDVQTSYDADLVDFEHFVYMISDGVSVDTLLQDFPAMLPMKYYSSRSVTLMMKGFKLIWESPASKLNRGYSAVYQRY